MSSVLYWKRCIPFCSPAMMMITFRMPNNTDSLSICLKGSGELVLIFTLCARLRQILLPVWVRVGCVWFMVITVSQSYGVDLIWRQKRLVQKVLLEMLQVCWFWVAVCSGYCCTILIKLTKHYAVPFLAWYKGKKESYMFWLSWTSKSMLWFIHGWPNADVRCCLYT